MKFIDHGLTPGHYRWKFLQYTDEIAPEVLASLKQLCPQYDKVFNSYGFARSLTEWLSGEVELVAQDESEILQLLDPIRRYHQLTDDDDLVNLDAKALVNFYSLRNDYSDFLEKFGFSTSDWLRELLFDFLGNLTYRDRNLNSLVFAYSHAHFPRKGNPFVFEFDGWRIENDSTEYAASTRLAFENKLQSYLNQTVRELHSDNYKQSTKPQAIDSVKWLVYWTVKQESKEAILQMITDGDEEGNKVITKKTLNAHFRRFKKEFDLPVRIG